MLWKHYGEDLVLAANRFNQIEEKTIIAHRLLSKELIGYVNTGNYWIVYREGKKIYRSFFAKNNLWFRALTSDAEFTVIRELPQIYLI